MNSPELEACIVGPFGMSEDFVTASAMTYKEMEATLAESGMGYQSTPFGDVLSHFGRQDTLAGKIIYGFLGGIATDAEILLEDDYLAAPVIIQGIDISKMDTRRVGVMHVDPLNKRAAIGARYLVANRLPTIIPDLPTLTAGVIARMPLGRTWHQKPKLQATHQSPRVLLIVDV